ncbi:hypothetical protein [Microbacterium sp. TNHR37B]|uniref:hypothetical protein n=1 Tax=Microbacterium sp. TNHR37B TaxID=1775956 RepID=UPI0012F7ADE3|nr:hypothetical protein [Microbacterium sp. TNHR37B]
MQRRGARGVCGLVGVAVSVAALTGCASPGGPSSSPSSALSPSPSVCVVAENPHAEPPEGCITYDPEANMALNESYRDRYPVGDDVVAAGAPYVDAVTAGLADLQGSASLTAEGVREVLARSGLPPEGIQTLGDTGSVAFGAILPAEVTSSSMAACLFGEVTTDRLAVEIGGLVQDGGCLAGPGGH